MVIKTSVIVPNHGRDISTLKASLPNDVELIVVDEGLERSIQRNMGIDRAKGPYLLFLDSDQSVSPGLIKECEFLLDVGFASIYIPEVILGSRLFTRIRAWERTFLNGTAVDVPRMVKASACPKFDISMSGPEDADWGMRIPGLRTGSKNPLYHHDDISFWEYCKKKAYYTKSMHIYNAKWKGKDKCVDFKYRSWTVYTENGKWKKLIRHPFLTLGIIFLLMTRMVIYYANIKR